MLKSLLGSTSAVDTSSFAFDSSLNPLDIDTAFETTYGINYEEENSKRITYCNKANEAIQNIEIIMGEFSGLGLCDIVAMIASLNLLPLEVLVSLIDEPAYKRMKEAVNSQLTNSQEIAAQIPVVEALTKLEASVKDWYNIMDIMYDSLKNNDGSDV